MLNNGYLYATDNKRLFINTCLGCKGNCSYCYLPKIGYSNSGDNLKVSSFEEIIRYLNNSSYKLNKDTLITLGCFSECFDDNNKKETIKIIKYFLENGNQVQVSTKTRVLEDDLKGIIPHIKYYGQLIIFISSSTIRRHNLIEKNTVLPNERFKSFELLKNKNIVMVLYIKPVLKNITIKDLDLYKDVILKYQIKDVVVGSIFTEEKSIETVHFSNDNKLFYNIVPDEKIIIDDLSSICRVYRRSTEVMKVYKN